MRVVAVINQKGGVGKTTTAANLAYAIAMRGYNVTLLDMDPQGHLAAYFGYPNNDLAGVEGLLNGEITIEDTIIEARDRIRLIPAGAGLNELEKQGKAGLGENLSRACERLNGQDFVFIDCPPASGILIDYALSAAGEILVPVAGDYLSLRGLSDIVMTLKKFEEKFNQPFNKWIVVTRFHVRRRLSWEVLDKLQEYFSGSVLATQIRENAALAESPGYGKTAFEYKKGNKGASDYEQLAKNFLKGEYYRG